jgi:hypothetical protein
MVYHKSAPHAEVARRNGIYAVGVTVLSSRAAPGNRHASPEPSHRPTLPAPAPEQSELQYRVTLVLDRVVAENESHRLAACEAVVEIDPDAIMSGPRKMILTFSEADIPRVREVLSGYGRFSSLVRIQ